MTSPGLVKQIIRERAIQRRERERKQLPLTDDNEDFCETIRSKLDGLLDSNQFWNFVRCGNEQQFRTCKQCRKVETYTYRCCIRWCPRCQWHIVKMRQRVIQLWAQKIAQPKHLVLTQKNFPVLTRRRIREHTHALARFRRSSIFRNVRGGCVSTEITNEGNGWHLHSHWLVDADWLDIKNISIRWGKIVGQNFAIVKVRDCRDRDYVQEVAKYVVEGSELASWPAEQINEFVCAIRGLRFFFSFGTLAALAPQIRAEINAQKPPPPICECGCSEFIYESEDDALAWEAMHDKRR